MDKPGRLERTIYLISLVMIAMGLIARVVAYLYNRSLFMDEAYLASSVIQRGYAGLFQPLDYIQGASVGFLILAKTCVVLLGSSEYALRLVPLLAGIGSVGLFYLVLKLVLKDPRPYIGTAFFATIPFLIYYSIEFKPYMLDGFLTLLTVLVFSQAEKHKIRVWVLCLYCALVVWFSFPVIFTLAAICMVWFLYSILKKNKDGILVSLAAGVVSLVSFGLFFATTFTYLQVDYELSYLQLVTFPLLPQRVEDLKLIYRMALEYFKIFGKGAALVLLPLSVLAGAYCLSRKRSWFGMFVGVEAVLLLIASWLGKYFILARLLIFIVPLHVLFVIVYLSGLWSRRKIFAAGLSLALLLANIPSASYFFPQYVYRPKLEINLVLNQLAKMDTSIPLYLNANAIPQYEFKTGYPMSLHSSPDSPIENHQVIYGSKYYNYLYKTAYSWAAEVDPARMDQNVLAITAHKQVYLLFVTYDIPLRDALIDALKKSGSVSQVVNIDETLVYLYQRSQ